MRSNINLITLQQRIFVVKAFYKNDSDVEWVKNNYMLEYGTYNDVLSESLIFEVINLFEKTGSVREFSEICNEQKDLSFALLENNTLLADVKAEESERTFNDTTAEHSNYSEIKNVGQEQEKVKKSPIGKYNIGVVKATSVIEQVQRPTINNDAVTKPLQTGFEVSNKQELTCDICNIKCKSKRGLQLHMITHKKKESMSCKYCQKMITTQYQLRLHMKTIHSDLLNKGKIEKKTMACSFCDKTFLQSNQLRDHLVKHSDKKNVICEICGKAFKRRYTLTQHMTIHTGEKRFKCDLPNCARAYRDRNSLTIHMRCHTDERPFSCEHCGKCFRDKGTLRIHYRQHTGENPYKCEICGKTTKQKQNLQSHMKHFHRITKNKDK